MTGAGVRRQVGLAGRQLYYEQLSFWRNPFAAFFTIGFSVIFLVLLTGTAGAHKIVYGHVTTIQFYMPGFAAYGIMSACFNTLAISLVVRRETGLLKRIRLSPLPVWAMIGALLLNALVVSIVQLAILFVVGRIGFGARFPANWAALAAIVVVGVVCFTAMGIAVSTLVPNQEAAGPMVSIVFFVMLFVSGLWFHLKAGSALAQFSKYFPIAHLITAMVAPFQLVPGTSPWALGDLGVIAIWGAGSVVVAARRFRFEPRRMK